LRVDPGPALPLASAAVTHNAPHSKLLLFAFLAMLIGASACGSAVGDSCETQTDCGQTMYCELSMPEGYCTRRNCQLDGCPDSGVCITFEPGISYCMRECETTSDCRDGYSCISDFGVHPFCNDNRGISPGSELACLDRVQSDIDREN